MDPYQPLQLSGPQPPEAIVVYTVPGLGCDVTMVWVLCFN